MSNTQIATDFIKSLFSLTESPIHFCSLGNERDGKHSPRMLNTRNPDELAAFMGRWDIAERGMFYCVGTLKQGVEKRNKANVAEIAMLHADIDLKDVDESVDEIVHKLKLLRYPPSTIVGSGNGVHALWLLTESILNPVVTGEVDRIEAALRQLADLIGGDLQVCEIARLMRLPGSHNSKRGEWKPVEVLESNGKRYHLDDLEEWLAEASPVILRKSRAPAVTAGQADDDCPYKRFAKEAGFKTPIDVKARLDAMIYMGGKDVNIHETQIAVEASMINSGYSDGDIVDMVMAATRAAAGEYEPRWNWRIEERNIRRDIAGWRADPRCTVKATPKPAPTAAIVSSEVPTPVTPAPATGKLINLADARTALAIKPKPVVDPNEATHVKLGKAVLAVIRDRGDDVMFTDKGDYWYSGGLWTMGAGGLNTWLNVEIETGAKSLNFPSTSKLVNETRLWIQRQNETNRRGTIPWDKHGLVPTKSGLINPRTGEVRPMRPDDYCTWRIEVEYDKDAECKWWLQMLDDVFADRTEGERAATIMVIQELLGAGLIDVKSKDLSKALIFLGGSNFGKSGLLEVLGGLFGQEVNSTPIEALEGAHGMMPFVHRRPWVLHEAFDQRKWHFSSSVKAIVTSEPIGVNVKNGPMLSIRVHAPIFWGTNHPPQFKEATRAITNRLVVIECKREFFEDNPVGAAVEARKLGLGKPSDLVLRGEMKGLLAWAMAGLKRALERGRLMLSKQMSESIEEIRRDSNLVDGFLTDCCFYSRDHRISVPDFCLAFAAWFLENKGENRSVPSNEVIGKALWALNDPKIAMGPELRDNKRRYLAGVLLNDQGLAFHEAGSVNRDLEGKTASATSPGVLVNQMMSADWCLKPSVKAMKERHLQGPKRAGSDTFLAVDSEVPLTEPNF
jgi:P4 family phage/plasmid primase-like protien